MRIDSVWSLAAALIAPPVVYFAVDRLVRESAVAKAIAYMVILPIVLGTTVALVHFAVTPPPADDRHAALWRISVGRMFIQGAVLGIVIGMIGALLFSLRDD
ncbi:MAG: hypothetical protein KY476_12505 [Planctomycetes bacterium]|nr:hypothetical protein [Planctomycetota bacterium]